MPNDLLHRTPGAVHALEEMKALEDAITPFISPWSCLVKDVRLHVLDQGSQLVGRHFEEKLQGFRISNDMVPQPSHIVLGLTSLNQTSAETIANLATDITTKMEAGGILALGGPNPEHPEIHDDGLHPEVAAEVLRKAGFARVRVLRPSTNHTEPGYLTTLYAMGRYCAVIAQKPATGIDFDVFSPAFAKHLCADPKARVYEAQAALINRIESENSLLKNKIGKIEEELHVMQRALNRATRRRGLRKLAYTLKTKGKALFPRNDMAPIEESGSDIALTSPKKETEKTVKMDASNPVPLSSHEIAVRTRLFPEEII